MALPNLENQNIQDTYQRVVQTDGNKVYDGTGSLLPIEFNENNVIISGTLTAQSYIVSESITSVSSGSTIFGNSSDDTHIFTGSLKLSGSMVLGQNQSIKAQDEYGNENDLIVQNYADAQIVFGDGDSEVKIVHAGLDLSGTETVLISHLLVTSTIQLGNQDSDVTSISGSISAVTNITASGNISSSGNVIAHTGSFERVETEITNTNTIKTTGLDIENSNGVFGFRFSTDSDPEFDTIGGGMNVGGTADFIHLNNHVTASGNISSSGFVHAAHISSSGDVVVGDSIIHNEDPNTKIGFGPDLIAFQAGGENFMSFTKNYGTPDSFSLNSFSTTDIQSNNITASGTISATGNISSSGELIGAINGGSF